MSRSLAHIEIIDAINPIANADSIEVATVLGWNVVIKKGEFKVGDKVIYIEIDSICPETPYFEFLRNKQFKVKTIKLRGQISQGLIVPISLVKEKYHAVGTDVTKQLGITKKDDSEVEPRKKKHGKFMSFLLKFKLFRKLFLKKKGKKKESTFPSWVKKTDETRIQNMPTILNNKNPFVVTEKVDGCSATYTYRKGKFVVASRNREADANSVYTDIANKYDIKKVLEHLYVALEPNDHITIQGEIVGPKIQGNKYGLTEPDFYVFNLIIDGQRFSNYQTNDIMALHGLKCVPVIHSEYILPDTIEEILKEADGTSKLANTLREGFVVRQGDISFKVVSNKFLLKNNE